MESVFRTARRRRFSSSNRVLAIVLAVLAVVSPVYVDRMSDCEPELEDEPAISLAACLPLILLFLVLTIAISLLCDQSLTRFDPYWIHRVGGSSGGLLVILFVLCFILKFKADMDCKINALELNLYLLILSVSEEEGEPISWKKLAGKCGGCAGERIQNQKRSP